jgi:outer membrane biosynthesis protein TonB
VDAGPTTTTTVTLGDASDLQGSKLTQSSSSTVETGIPGATHGPHQSDPGRSVKDIQAIIVSRRDEARACYDSALKAHPGIEGKVDVTWVIDPKGKVTDVSVDPSTSQITEPAVVNCIAAIIKQIHFNESARGFETRAHYPFDFHPRARGSADAGAP